MATLGPAPPTSPPDLPQPALPAPIAFAPQLSARLSGWVLALGSLPHGYRCLGFDLQQGPCLELDGPEGTLWLLADLSDEKGYARTARLRLTHQPGHVSGPQREVLAAAVAILRELDDGHWPTPALADGAEDGVRHVRATRVLTRGPNLPTDWAINPYIGCSIGCAYCNARFGADDVRTLDGRPARPWGQWVDAQIDAPEVLRREIEALPVRQRGLVCCSPVVTDPWLELEATLQLTRRCLEVLAEARMGAVVLTRSALVCRDLDVLARLPRAAVGVTLSSEDPALLARLEPGAATLDQRLGVLRRAKDAGLATFALVQPALTANPSALAALLAPLVDAVRVDSLHEGGRLGRVMDGVPRPAVATVEAAFAACGVSLDLGRALGGGAR